MKIVIVASNQEFCRCCGKKTVKVKIGNESFRGCKGKNCTNIHRSQPHTCAFCGKGKIVNACACPVCGKKPVCP